MGILSIDSVWPHRNALSIKVHRAVPLSASHTLFKAIFPPPMLVIFTNKEFHEIEKYLSEERWFRLYVREKDSDLQYWRPCVRFSDGKTQYEGDYKLFVSEIEKIKNSDTNS